MTATLPQEALDVGELGEFTYNLFADVSAPIRVEVVDTTSADLVYDEEYGVQVMALSPIESSTGLKGILLDLFGPYDGIVVQYRYIANSTNNYTYVNDVQPDYPWLCSALLFIAVIYSLFRIGGRMLWPK